MTLYYSLLIAAAASAFAVPFQADAQTCRVAVGVSPSGVTTYKEVYEYDYVEVKPEFPGGDCKLMSFINENRRYPAAAYRDGIQGRVLCSFVVNSDGKISNISVLRGVEESLNREAVRIMSRMPQWTPGRIDGQAVPVRVIWAVPFRK